MTRQSVLNPTVLALDFDGVICDGLIEYFETSWRAYCQLWSMSDLTPPAGMREAFYRLRPVIETGWEMPVLLRALALGTPEEKILLEWLSIAQEIVAAENLKPVELAAAVDGLRDQWIATDLSGWLSLHRFYPGIVEKLQMLLSSSLQLVIISTKEGRFIQELLHQAGVAFPESQIFGKETRRPKPQILRELLGDTTPAPEIWFVEDRLPTLRAVKAQPDLANVQLFLADWGYNIERDRAEAAADDRIQPLTLSQFADDFLTWLKH